GTLLLDREFLPRAWLLEDSGHTKKVPVLSGVSALFEASHSFTPRSSSASRGCFERAARDETMTHSSVLRSAECGKSAECHATSNPRQRAAMKLLRAARTFREN